MIVSCLFTVIVFFNLFFYGLRINFLVDRKEDEFGLNLEV